MSTVKVELGSNSSKVFVEGISATFEEPTMESRAARIEKDMRRAAAALIAEADRLSEDPYGTGKIKGRSLLGQKREEEEDAESTSNETS